MLTIETLQDFSKRVLSLKDVVSTEEGTKQAMILPFFSMSGYNVFNPLEFVPEYTADVGVKKGEKVDYAIIEEGKPLIIVECKSCSENLNNHYGQLFRYFAVTDAKFAILTNGLEYRFYSDLDKDNIMDSVPFLTVNLASLNDRAVEYLGRFVKGTIDVDSLTSTAKEFKYQSLICENFKKLLDEPTEVFIRALLGDEIKSKKDAMKQKFLVKKTINSCINEMMRERFGNSLNSVVETEGFPEETGTDGEEEYFDIDLGNGVVTTADEQKGFDMVKSILSDYIDSSRLSYKDTKSHFTIILDGKVTQWVCRFKFNKSTFHVYIPYERVIEQQCRVKRDFALKSLEELSTLKDELVMSLNRYLCNGIESIHIEDVSKENGVFL